MPCRANATASTSRTSRGTPAPEPVTSTTPGRVVLDPAGFRTVPCSVRPPLPRKLTSVAVMPAGAGTGRDGAAAAGPAPRTSASMAMSAVFMSWTLDYRESSANRCLQKYLCGTRLTLMEDETEPLILDDPGRLKALSHPLRRQILHQLNTRGPATSTTIGAALGANTGTTSYHLRRLEMYGFIEEIPERSAGRERWWRRTSGYRDLRMPEPEKLAAEDRVILTELLRIRHTEDMELLGRLPEAYTQDRAWTMLSRGLTHMTQEGLAEFVEAYLRLLRQHGHRSDDAPPASRPVHIRLFTLPADEFPAPGSPHSSETSQDHPGGLLK